MYQQCYQLCQCLLGQVLLRGDLELDQGRSSHHSHHNKSEHKLCACEVMHVYT